MSKKNGRRRFLFGAGGALAIPCLPSLLSRSARAEEETPPLRFVVVYTPQELIASQTIPVGAGRDFTLSPVLEPLAPHRDNMLFLQGMVGGHGHHAAHSEFLTGRPSSNSTFLALGGPSLDQMIAAGHGGETPLASLELGIDSGSNVDGMIAYTPAGLPIPTTQDPGGAFARVASNATIDPATLQRLNAQRGSVLDFIMSDFDSISSQLGTEEARLMDQHLTLLREQEQRLMNPVSPNVCDLPAASTVMRGDTEGTMRSHMDTIAAAFRCDTTRVATLVMGRSQYSSPYNFLGIDDSFHDIAHGDTTNWYEDLQTVQRWHAGRVEYLASQLAAVEECNGSLLDNTVILWLSELGITEGAGHSKANTGATIVGGRNIGLDLGRSLDLGGVHYHDFLLTIGQLFGHDIESFGDDGTTSLLGELT